MKVYRWWAVDRLVPYNIGLMHRIDQSYNIDAKWSMWGESEAVTILLGPEKANAIRAPSSAGTNGTLQPMLRAPANR
jgi:hypothetical protein